MSLPSYYAHITIESVSAVIEQAVIDHRNFYGKDSIVQMALPDPQLYLLFCRALFTLVTDPAMVRPEDKQDAALFREHFILHNPRPMPDSLFGFPLDCFYWGQRVDSDISRDIISHLVRRDSEHFDLKRYASALNLVGVTYSAVLPLLVAEKHKALGSDARILPHAKANGKAGSVFATDLKVEAFLCDAYDLDGWSVSDDIKLGIIGAFRECTVARIQSDYWTRGTLHFVRGLIDADYARDFEELLVEGEINNIVLNLFNVPGRDLLNTMIDFVIDKLASGEAVATPIAGEILHGVRVSDEQVARFSATQISSRINAAETQAAAPTKRGLRTSI